MSGRHHAHVWTLQIECVIKFQLCEWAEMKAGKRAYAAHASIRRKEVAWLFWQCRRSVACGAVPKAT